MSTDQSLLESLLDSWDRNNTILLNLLRILPESGLEIRAMEGSPSVGEMFMHIHYVRLVFISEDASEFANNLPEGEWKTERDLGRMTAMLTVMPSMSPKTRAPATPLAMPNMTLAGVAPANVMPAA